MDISIIIPAYNEKESIRALYQKIIKAMEPLGKDFEIIFIDDGSMDGTYEEISSLCVSDPRVRGIKLRRNFGKSVALNVGFKEARGDIVFTMDADLQDDPEEMPKFIEKINEGWDMVSGWKQNRQDPLEKRIASKVFNNVVSKISGLKLHDFNCGFKVYKKDLLKIINIYGELHRFIPIIASSYGFKVGEIIIKHHKRQFGRSKFGIGRYLSGFFDLFSVVFITGYLRRPLHFLGRISLTSFAMGFILLIYVFVEKFILGELGNRPALTIAVFLLGLAVQIFIFGLLADMLSYTNNKENFKGSDFIKEKTESNG